MFAQLRLTFLPYCHAHVYHASGNLKAKLGEKNKFYYDEKLKRWVEEGAETPAEEPALPPPPKATTSFGLSEQSVGNTLKTENNVNDAFKQESPNVNSGPAANPQFPLERNATILPSQNHFSARGRMGVRSRLNFTYFFWHFY